MYVSVKMKEGDQGSSVSIVTRLQVGEPESHVSVPRPVYVEFVVEELAHMERGFSEYLRFLL